MGIALIAARSSRIYMVSPDTAAILGTLFAGRIILDASLELMFVLPRR